MRTDILSYREYINCIRCAGLKKKQIRKESIKILVKDARKNLPKGCVFEIRALPKMTSVCGYAVIGPLGSLSMAEKLFKAKSGFKNAIEYDTFILLARIKA